jgi:Mn-dependent DtxR family transcriptional regulator/DNA-directed RNA polymerase subunit M/transcription elongation factor TFIIS
MEASRMIPAQPKNTAVDGSADANVSYCPGCGFIQSVDQCKMELDARSNDESTGNICVSCKLPLEERRLVSLRTMRAKDLNVPALVKIRVSAETQQKAVNTKYNAHCEKCGESREIDLLAPEMADTLIQLLTKSSRAEFTINKFLPRKVGAGDEKHSHKWLLTPIEASDYRILQIRDLVGLEEVSEKSLVARDYTAYFLSTLTSNKTLVLDGEVFVNPRNDDLTFLSTRAHPLANSVEDFRLDERKTLELKKLLSSNNYEELLSLADCTIAPIIVGRALAKLASLVATCSPNWFRVKGVEDPVPGCIKLMLVGDKRTGKGTIARWYYYTLAVSEHGIGESASRAGLLYCVDSDKKMILWGLLPQADLGLATIEGLHGISSDQLAEFREALVSQKVKVNKKVTGEAWCRARIIADANASKNLKDFVFPVQAILSVPCFLDPVDIVRWDLFVAFDEDSVSMRQITELKAPPGRPLPLDILRNLVMFAWSRKIDQIVVTDEAIEYARKSVVENLSKYRTGEIPLLHNGSLWSLLRISIAFAILTFSVEGENVLILQRHAEMAENLIKELLDQWEIEQYIRNMGATTVTDEDLDELINWLKGKEAACAVLRELSIRSWQGNDLAKRIGYDDGHTRNTMSQLRSRELVMRRAGSYTLTAKGAALVKKQFLSKNKNEEDDSVSLKENMEKALWVLRKMMEALDGGNPLRSDYINRLRETGLREPERLVDFLEDESLIYAPTEGHVRGTKL